MIGLKNEFLETSVFCTKVASLSSCLQGLAKVVTSSCFLSDCDDLVIIFVLGEPIPAVMRGRESGRGFTKADTTIC